MSLLRCTECGHIALASTMTCIKSRWPMPSELLCGVCMGKREDLQPMFNAEKGTEEDAQRVLDDMMFERAWAGLVDWVSSVECA